MTRIQDEEVWNLAPDAVRATVALAREVEEEGTVGVSFSGC